MAFALTIMALCTLGMGCVFVYGTLEKDSTPGARAICLVLAALCMTALGMFLYNLLT